MAKSPMLPEYKYEDIQSRSQLRVLQLRGAQSRDAALVCELKTIEAENAPNESPVTTPDTASQGYEALSWCWGNQQRDRVLEIYRNGLGFHFMITKSLEDALRALRYRDRDRYLWVDFLCINQADKTERNDQVSQMRMIYEGANRVCVWLGPGDDKTKDAFDFIRKLLNVWDFDKVTKSDELRTSLRAFWRLVNQPWFSRRWVVQEIALARKAEVYSGTESIDWAEFADAVSMFVVHEASTHTFSSIMADSENIRDAFNHASEMGATTLIEATSTLFRGARDGLREPLLSLEYLVSKFTTFESTQPRDAIYGLLAIAKDTTAKQRLFQLIDLWKGKEIGGVSPVAQLTLRAFGRMKIHSKDFKVDYNEPVISVYQRFIQFAMERAEPTRALDILCRPWAPRFTVKDEKAGFHEALNGNIDIGPSSSSKFTPGDDDQLVQLPSWIGTQDEKPFVLKAVGNQRDAFRKMNRKNADPLVGHPIAGRRTYMANGSLGLRLDDVKFQQTDSSHSMFVKGFIIDEVKVREVTSQNEMIPVSWLGLGGWKIRKQDPPDDLWRTLVGNRGPNSENAPPFYRRACREAFKNFEASDSINTHEIISEGRSSIVTAFLKRVQAVTWRRALIKTSSGRLGLVYHATQEADFICILDGCSVPVVLRRHLTTLGDLENARAQKEQDDSKKLANAVGLLEAMRKQQLNHRRSNDVWQRRQSWIRLVQKLRLLWLFTLPLVYIYHLDQPYNDSLPDLAIFFLALSTTSEPEIKALVPRWIKTEAQKYLWLLLNRQVKTVLLMVSSGYYMTNACQPAPLLWSAFAFSTLLFPSLLLCPFGLPRNLISRDLLHFVEQPQRLIHSTQRGLRNAASSSLLAFMPSRRHKKAVVTNNDWSSEYWWQLIGPAYIHGIMDGEAVNIQIRMHADIAEALRREKLERKELSPELKERESKRYAQRQMFELR